MRQAWRALALGLAVALIGAPAGAAQIVFSDQTLAADLGHAPEQTGDMEARPMFSGGAVGDFDRDGWPDIFLLGAGHVADALFMNDGDGTFTDRAADWGVALQHRGRGATVGDFNADGWPDIYITSGGDLTNGDRPGQNILYRNNGDGSFTNVALAAGVHQTSSMYNTATGAAFGDYDLDGDLDLFVCGWESVDGNRLFRNDGDETFTDVTTSTGIDYGFDGFSPRFVDMDGDRYPELVIAADFFTGRYFVNQGDGTFVNRTVQSGTGLESNGMGATIGDFNRDGRPDWYVTSIYGDTTTKDGNYLYINQGNHQYTVLPEADGARNGGWGWGVEAVDLDHDGFIDIAETNGWITSEWEFELAYLFRNNGDMTFSEVQDGSGFLHWGQGRSLMTLDYDRDGDMDILLTSFEAPVALFRNDLSGPDAHWLEIRLDTSGRPGLAPDGYGSRIVVTAGGAAQYFWLNGGATYLGRSQQVAHFGLGTATVVDQLLVEWADGTATVWNDVAANQILTMSPVISGAPGEASAPSDPTEQMRAGYEATTGIIELTYTPSCGATNHTIYYGDLADVGSYGYSGAVCGCGTSGTTSFDPVGLSSAFFLIVGNTGTVEGPYGSDGSGQQRPEDLSTVACDLPQDLTGTCDLP
jgi:hypothetical protein